MSITFGSNISSLRAQRQIGKVTSDLGSVFEKLSSGLRINSASDDAAGLAISSALDVDRRAYSQGVRNLNDGISLLNVADGAMEQLETIVTRLKELAEQAANGTYGVTQRKALDTEAQALSREYSRIGQTTSFNGLSLLSASLGQIKVQGGYGLDGGITSNLGGSIGNGEFGNLLTAATQPGANSQSQDVAVGDLNGDGIQDIVTTGFSASTGTVAVNLGVGDGTFGTATSYAAESISSLAIKLADFNNDGIMDIATAGTGASTGQVTVRLGRGDGTFGSTITYATESSGSSDLSLGDLNGDGFVDIVTAGTGATFGAVTIRFGAGNGTFGAALSYQMGPTYSSTVALGDLNNDGILDIVSGGSGSGSFVSARLGRGDGTFQAMISISTLETDGGLALGDINDDGYLDAVYGGGTGPGAGAVGILFGTGTGGFVSGSTFSGGHNFSVALTDFNGDGRLDFIDSARTLISVRLGTGGGSFAAAATYTVGGGTSLGMTLGDFDGNGAMDFISVGNDASSMGQARVRLQNTSTGVGPLLPFKLTSRADALQALPGFDRVLNRLTTQRGIIGAFQSRLTSASNTLGIATENYASAGSQITDADVATEAAALVRLKILQQSAGAVLAQANQQPAVALKLLNSKIEK